MTIDDAVFLHKKLPRVAYEAWREQSFDDLQDALMAIGLLYRLADGLLSDGDLEGKWVATFIEDRRKVPPVLKYGRSQPGGWKPIELGWVMALAREVDADPKCWEYFSKLSQEQLDNPRLRPGLDPVLWKKNLFVDKYSLVNRDSSLGIFALLYAKKNQEIDDITDINQVKIALRGSHRTEASLVGGFNLDIYFEDLNR